MTTLSEMAEALRSGDRLPVWIEGLKEIRASMATSGIAKHVYTTSIGQRSVSDDDFAMALAMVEDALERLKMIEARQ